MPNIERNIHFIWVGKLIPSQYIENIFNWIAQNPMYQVHLWTEGRMIPEYVESAIILYKHSTHAVDLANLAVEDTDKGKTIHFEHSAQGSRSLTINAIGALEAIGESFFVAEAYEGWKNYGEVSDVLRIWVLHSMGGLYMDCDTYPAEAPLPLEINALRGILFGWAPEHRGNSPANYLIAAPKGHPKLLSLAMFISQRQSENYESVGKGGDETKPLAGVYKPSEELMTSLANVHTARSQLAVLSEEAGEEREKHRSVIRGELTVQALFVTGNYRILEWIKEEEQLKDGADDELDPGDYFDEMERGEIVRTEYIYQIQTGHQPVIESHCSWMK